LKTGWGMNRGWVIGLLALPGLVWIARAPSAADAGPLPESLAQWYKPVNKRQVWLHNMFKLRRSMQAVSEYAAREDADRMAKWARRFAEAYRRIPEMVPEWRDEVDLSLLSRLEDAVARGDYAAVDSSLYKLGTTCRSCHNEYRTLAILQMRVPDFEGITVGAEKGTDAQPYGRFMEGLSTQVNRIKIGAADGLWESAGAAAVELRRALRDLGSSCAQCHRDAYPRERILGTPIQAKLDELDAALKKQDVKRTGRLLGHLGYNVCARCHSIHRTLAELKGLLGPPAQAPP